MNAVLFDLDETILDRTGSLEDFALWQANGMLKEQITNPKEFCERFIELDKNGSVWKDVVYSDLVKEFDITGWSVSELLLSYELAFCGFCKPKAGVITAIKTLHQKGYSLGLVSNGKTPFQERNFNALGICGLFGAVVVSEAVGVRKPEPDIFNIACTSLGVEPEQVIFVGDNPEKDIDGAKKMGMYTVYIPGYFGATYSGADVTCSDYNNLVSIVLAA